MTKKNLHSTFYIPHSNFGFTLMEMLISISVFMLFIGVVGSSYVSLVKANKQANDIQKIYREARNAIDTMASSIKNSTIDYSCVDDTKPLDVFCIENQGSETKKIIALENATKTERNLFKFSDKNIFILRQNKINSDLPWAAETDWQPLISEQYIIEEGVFSVTPQKNPYATENAADDTIQRQPAIGISFKINGYPLRTTYSSRFYGK